MTNPVRRLSFLLASLLLAAAVVAVARHMPAFGAHPLPYGDAVNRIAPDARHVSNMVSAVNFDFRGFDTLGEEFMLVCAVTGTVMLLRGHRGEDTSAEPGELPDRPAQRPSDGVVLMARLIGPALAVLGLYMVLHAMVTPGGGFQGGVIIASATLLLWLAEGYRGWRSLMGAKWLDAVEGCGALVFVLCGLAPLTAGGRFMENLLPYGQFRDMLSGGLMQLENAGVALAVAGGFCLLFLEFLEETRAPKEDGS